MMLLGGLRLVQEISLKRKRMLQYEQVRNVLKGNVLYLIHVSWFFSHMTINRVTITCSPFWTCVAVESSELGPIHTDLSATIFQLPVTRKNVYSFLGNGCWRSAAVAR